MFTRIIVGLTRALHEEDFSVAQIAVLYLLDEEGNARLGDVAERIGRSMPTASRLVDGLVKRGLVTREEDPEDRRAKRLALTSQGTKLVAYASEERMRTMFETAQSLPAGALEQVLAQITKARR